MARSRPLALLTQRCPVCLEGRAFRSFLGMHADCPHCGVHFERESGYFLTAMFFAYTMGFVILAPTALYLYFTGAEGRLFGAVIAGETILLWPLIFRYSRILWMHVDQLLDPRDPSV